MRSTFSLWLCAAPGAAVRPLVCERGTQRIETGRWLRAVCGTSVVFVTSEMDANTVQRIHEQVPGAPVVTKPVHRDNLAKAVQATLVHVQTIPEIQSKPAQAESGLSSDNLIGWSPTAAAMQRADDCPTPSERVL